MLRSLPSETVMRDAFAAKDAAYDGVFFVAVKTTGIFCRPVCRAKTPRPENIEFFPSALVAEKNGYRPCKLCKPAALTPQPPAVVQQLMTLIAQRPGERLTEYHLRAEGIDPSTARRQFLATTGQTFARYQREHRLGQALRHAKTGAPRITAQLAAGFESASGFRAAAEKLFGSPPTRTTDSPTLLTSAWIPTPLGPMLAVAHDEGLVMLDFADRRSLETALLRLRQRFAATKSSPPAAIVPGSHRLLDQVTTELDEYFAGKRLTFRTPLYPAGSDFEQKAWAYLRDIPPGQTRTYGQQAAAIGSHGASRAAGKANGMNYIAILIPCHRVIGAAGKLTGYGGGLHRKAWLLEHEQHAAMQLAARGQAV